MKHCTGCGKKAVRVCLIKTVVSVHGNKHFKHTATSRLCDLISHHENHSAIQSR